MKSLVEIDALIDAQITSLPGWCDAHKAKRIARVAIEMTALGGERAVELGVYGGRSLIALALGLQLAGRGTIDGIDSWSREDNLEGDQAEVYVKLWGQDTNYEECLRHTLDGVQRFGVQDFARVVRKRTDEAATDYENGSIDLIHLDSNHTELVSCRDMTTWLPKMASKSIFIADDTNWPSMQRALGILEAAGFTRSETGPDNFWAVYHR
jgi:predicted O-methyltransferase YrrM